MLVENMRNVIDDRAEDGANEANDENDGGGGQRNGSTAKQLVDMAVEGGIELFASPGASRDCFATITVSGHRETYRLESTAFKEWLCGVYFAETGAVASSAAVKDAISTMCGMARFNNAPQSVSVRIAEHKGRIYIDLADAEWRAIEVDTNGWRIVSSPPVRFIRPSGMLPLPIPEQTSGHGALDELRRLLNVSDDEGWRLLLAWLISTMRPSGPFPLLSLTGEQGTSKSTTARVLRSLVDPFTGALRCEPRSERDLAIAASNSCVLAFDNLSSVKPWLSDALCRLSTGGGFAARSLFTDREETILDVQRPCILTGIPDLATRPDLVDRTIVIELARIPESRRVSEREFWRVFEELRPRVLGVLLDAVSMGLREQDTTRLDNLPRMADFAVWASAAGPALGYSRDEFIEAFTQSRERANLTALEADPVAVCLMAYMHDREEWIGSATELKVALDPCAVDLGVRDQSWPKRANVLSGTVRRLAPVLRSQGWHIEFDDRDSLSRVKQIRIRRPAGFVPTVHICP